MPDEESGKTTRNAQRNLEDAHETFGEIMRASVLQCYAENKPKELRIETLMRIIIQGVAPRTNDN